MKFGEKRGEVIRMDTYNMIDFNEKKGFICDMDGVIYHGNRVLPGVAEFIQWLHDENKEYLFLTNNSGYTPRELSQKLARMGLDVTEEHFYTSALATAAFLRDQAPGCSVFAIGEAGLLNALYDAGITMNDVNPDYVVVGEGRSYSLDTLTKATNLVWKGAKLIGANSDVSGPIENGIVPACRALVAPIEMATGTQAYFCGTPYPFILRINKKVHKFSRSIRLIGVPLNSASVTFLIKWAFIIHVTAVAVYTYSNNFLDRNLLTFLNDKFIKLLTPQILWNKFYPFKVVITALVQVRFSLSTSKTVRITPFIKERTQAFLQIFWSLSSLN